MDPAEALRILDAELARGLDAFRQAASLEELDRAETAVLGRKAPFSEVQRSLGGLHEADRRSVGQRANEDRESLRSSLEERRQKLLAEAERDLLEADRIDVTLPGRRPRPGSLHPLTVVEYEIVDIFTRMGYRVVEGPEVETEWYNFDALNIPPDHPARKVTDTLYLDLPGLVLRTETSAMQIRTMEKQQPPVYVIAPGRVYRRGTPDAPPSSGFHPMGGGGGGGGGVLPPQ